MKAVVMGSGAWGTALALVLLENGHQVTLWSYLPEESQVMARQGENPMLKGVPLPKELCLTAELDCVQDCELLVLATPSFAVRSMARTLKGCVKAGTVLVLVSKGIEKDTGLLLSQVVGEELGDSYPLVVLSGPSHAEEVGRHVPTAVVAASQHQQTAEQVQDAFMNHRFRVYTSPDVIGVEVGAALKNVMALCVGFCDGMGLGDNTKAALMTRGLTEIARLGVAMGGRKETFAGLAGMGDLIVTCTSVHSRNHRAGILIGQGKSAKEAVEAMNGAVVEGYYAAQSALALSEKLGVDMPITRDAYAVLYEGKNIQEVVEELMTRDKREELETEKSWL